MPKEPNGLVMFPLEVSRETERLFENMISRPWGICREIRGWHPSLDLYETEDAFILEADLPGVKQEDVTIQIENNQLMLRGSRSVESGLLAGRFHVMERSSGYFVRQINLPEPVNNATVIGKYHDGVLRARFLKTKRSQT